MLWHWIGSQETRILTQGYVTLGRPRRSWSLHFLSDGVNDFLSLCQHLLPQFCVSKIRSNQSLAVLFLNIHPHRLHQQSPTFLAPAARFTENSSSSKDQSRWGDALGMLQAYDAYCAPLFPLTHQLHLKPSGIRFWRLEAPALLSYTLNSMLAKTPKWQHFRISIALKLSSDFYQSFKHRICSGKLNDIIRVLNA